MEEITRDNRDLIKEPITDEELANEVAMEEEYSWKHEVEGLLVPFMEKHKCIMVGTVKRWNGIFAGGEIGDFGSLLESFLAGSDYAQIQDVDGHLIIKAIHHDGVNEMEAKLLPKDSYEAYKNWKQDDMPGWENMTEHEVYKELFDKHADIPRFVEHISKSDTA